MDKVDNVHQQVQDILSGKIDVHEMDKKMKEAEKLEKAKEEIKQREAKEALLKGRPGKGYKKTGWKTFCQACWTEFFVDGVDKCTHCGRATVTFEVSAKLGVQHYSKAARVSSKERNFQNLIQIPLGSHGNIKGQVGGTQEEDSQEERKES